MPVHDSPGDRQVLPGFIEVYKSGQSIFQMGDDLNLFDFVTLKNVVHAHLLAADRLDNPQISAKPLVSRLEPVQCTIKRRRLPTSLHQDVVDPSKPPPQADPPLPAMRNRWNQFACSDDEPIDASNLSVAGQAFFITNGEPVTFWTFARAVYFAYSQKPPRWWDPIVLPKSVGMLYAQLSETIGRFQGKKPEDCAVPTAHMQYVLHDLYFDIERVRRASSPLVLVALGRADATSLAGTSSARLRAHRESRGRHQDRRRGESGSRGFLCDRELTLLVPQWYKADEARQAQRSAAADQGKKK